MSRQEQLKKLAAEKALEYIPNGVVLGVGSGSTVNYFIEALAKVKHKIDAAVASSIATEKRLKACGISVYDLNSVADLPLYIDGADEFNVHGYLIKGGGGALTREKIIAAVAKEFVCIVDEKKQVDVLGKFPLPIEVIPMARSYVARELVRLGGEPEYRQGFVTDNGNVILDVYHLDIVDPPALEKRLNNIVGVVSNGLFAERGADKIIVASEKGINILTDS